MSVLFEIETSEVQLVWRSPANIERATIAGVGEVLGVLKIKACRADITFIKRWPSPPEQAPKLFEETNYRLFLKSNSKAPVSIQHADPMTCAALLIEDEGRINTGIINFRSNVGLTRFTVLVDNKPEFEFEIEVFPTKLDYKSDYELMLAETRWHIADLVFEYLRPTFKFANPSKQKEPDEFSWIFILRKFIEQLEFAARYIAHNPARALISEHHLTAVEKIRRIDSSVRRAVHRRAGTGDISRFGDIELREKIPHRITSFTLDTPEHRWIAHQLHSLRDRLRVLTEQVSTSKTWRQNKAEKNSGESRKIVILDDLADLSRRIHGLEKLAPFETAKAAPPTGYASLQLMSAPGYKECYQILTLLRYGLTLDFGILQLSLKEISLLYEYWCFLTLVSMIAHETGTKVPVREIIQSKQSGLAIALTKGEESNVPFSLPDGRKITVTYNKKFALDDDSILIPQKPDMMVTLEGNDWPKLRLLLDTKYRIRCDDSILELYKSPGPDQDAINSLHRYRDAILEIEKIGQDQKPKRTVIQAAAIFPYRDPDGSYSDSRLWRGLEKIGIGAIPLVPTEKRYLQIWLSTLLHSGDWSLADKAIPHLAVEKREDWRRAASEAVLIGILPAPNVIQRFAWLKENKCYFMPLRKQHPRQFSVKQVAIYEPFANGGKGAICLAADVSHIEITPRSQLLTPWTPRDRAKEDCVVYHLANIRTLRQPIANKDSEPVLAERWTTRLSLERAKSLNELFLEAEPEWRLYELLQNEDIEFKVRAGKIRKLDVDGSSRRAIFEIEEKIEIVFAGADGFIVTCMEIKHYVPDQESAVSLVKRTIQNR